MPIACKFCLLPGESGVSHAKGNIFETNDELYDHIEDAHDLPVQREGESEEQTKARFEAKNKRAGGPDCQCPACKQNPGLPEAVELMKKVEALRDA